MNLFKVDEALCSQGKACYRVQETNVRAFRAGEAAGSTYRLAVGSTTASAREAYSDEEPGSS
ncbi:MAG: hypothetical protein HY900_28895 [Deltaproteobacteria bacterium]|nr:hypothetical protein [Deltaproteobacteria bacterium]